MIRPKDPLARFHARQRKAKAIIVNKNLVKARKTSKLTREIVKLQGQLFNLRNNPYVELDPREINLLEKKLVILRDRLIKQEK